MLERIVEILVALAVSLGGAAGAGLGQAADRVAGGDSGGAPVVQPATVHDDPAEDGREIALAQFEAIQARIAEALAAAASNADEAAAEALAHAAEAAAAGLQKAVDAVSGAAGDGTSGDLPIPDGLPSVIPSGLPVPPIPPAGRP